MVRVILPRPLTCFCRIIDVYILFEIMHVLCLRQYGRRFNNLLTIDARLYMGSVRLVFVSVQLPDNKYARTYISTHWFDP